MLPAVLAALEQRATPHSAQFCACEALCIRNGFTVDRFDALGEDANCCSLNLRSDCACRRFAPCRRPERREDGYSQGLISADGLRGHGVPGLPKCEPLFREHQIELLLVSF